MFHLADYKVYDFKHYKEFILDSCEYGTSYSHKNKGYYYALSCSFDIETTSFYSDGSTTYDFKQKQALGSMGEKLDKCAIMYIWQFGINGNVLYGRNWNEFKTFYEHLCDTLVTNLDMRLIVYVHNLAFEFQFIRTLIDWENVFSIDTRKPIYALSRRGVEFRCSYLLSGYSLAKLGEQLNKYKVAKLVGDLDYSLLRHTGTPLTAKELGYCVNDVRVVMAYIQEKIESEGISKIPITKTGYVRNFCRKRTLYKEVEGKRKNNYKYRDLMRSLVIGSMQEFKLLQRAFAGGFTHANAHYVGTIQKQVASYDFTSSYPSVMIAEKFPMSRGVKITLAKQSDFYYYIKNYCCVFDVEFTNIVSKLDNDTPISSSKCFLKEGVMENNGRVFSATRIQTTLTDIDFRVISTFYVWGSMRVGTMYIYKKEYLPTEFVKSILELYQKKTTLKGVRGKEVEYLQSKEMLNSCYGMAVTNPLRDEYLYEESQWVTNEPNVEQQSELLFKYNNSLNRFLFYPWGIFVTAYARRNLFTGIYECGEDYIYADTDSVKILNHENHKEYFERYNERIKTKLADACKFHKIDFSLCAPKTIKGVEKMLGVWDFEGVYERFKTLGAKRYMVQENDALFVGDKSYNYSLTISGVNKFTAIPYLIEKYGDNIFDEFNDNLKIPCEGSGKNIHTYIDECRSGVLTDYMGESRAYNEPTGVHLEPSEYNLSLAAQFIEYLKGIKLTKKY